MTTTPKTRPAAQRIGDACDLLDEARTGYEDDIGAHGFDPTHAREVWYDDTSLTVVCDVRLPAEAIDDDN